MCNVFTYNIYAMTPTAHMSIFVSYFFPINTSGAVEVERDQIFIFT